MVKKKKPAPEAESKTMEDLLGDGPEDQQLSVSKKLGCFYLACEEDDSWMTVWCAEEGYIVTLYIYIIICSYLFRKDMEKDPAEAKPLLCLDSSQEVCEEVQ